MHAAAEYVSELVLLFDGERSNEEFAERLHESYGKLLTNACRGDAGAFDQLVLALAGPLTGYARRFTSSIDAAQDLVQDVFAHVWEHRTTLIVHGSVRGYFYTAVRNRALDVRKRDDAESARWGGADGASPVGMAESSYAADDDVYRHEIVRRVAAALDTLSPRAREAALLRWRDGLSRAEIAKIMGVAIPTVNNQLTAAAKIVRDLLADLRSDG